MNRALMIAGVPVACTGLAVFVAAVAVAAVTLVLWLVRATWAWVVPDLFPGAVTQGLVADSISWWTAFKLVVALAIAGVILNGGTGRMGN